jgi:glycerophosphoryl diester phosphodiesterase
LFTRAVSRLIAHRGSARESPENSIAAFVDALALGAHGVELDVRCSADEALVVHHDSSVEGLGPISELRVAQLPAEVPLLGAALEACGEAEVYVEIKSDPATSAEWVAEEVLRAIADAAVRATITSFDLEILSAARRLDSEGALGWLLLGGVDLGLVLQLAAERQLTALQPWHQGVDAALVERTHQAGLALAAWTVNEPADLSRMFELGVDAVITDDVALARLVREASGGS